MRGKKAMEIAINTLVVIILGMVILGMGFVFVRKIIDTGIDLSGDVDDQLMESMRQTQFADGRQVAILNPQAIVKAGDSEMFLLGFVNKLGSVQTFKVKVAYSTSSPVNGNLNGVDPMKGVLFLDLDYTLDPNDEEFMWILIEPQKGWPRGQYLFDVFVCKGDYDCTQDTNSQFLYTGQKHRIFLTVQ